MTVISIDVGYGYTKAVSENGEKISFPSVTAPLGVNRLEGMYNGVIDYRVRIANEGRVNEALIGRAALMSNSCRAFVGRQEKPEDMHDALLLTAAYLLSNGSNNPDIILAAGLPLSYYKNQKNKLRERLSNLSACVMVNGGQEKYISFKGVSIFPQGTGVLAALDEIPEKGRIGVLDIGTYTTDYLLFEIQDNMPIPIVEGCGSVETGIFLAQKAIAMEYEKVTGSTLPLSEYQSVFEDTINGQPVVFWGKKIDLFPAWMKIQRQIAETIVSGAIAAWEKQIDKLVLTVFAGGGSALLFDIVKDMFPCPYLMEEGYFANAVGFLKMCAG
ncbi:MAG: hypothetical protein XD50_1358 [Clostridia bacterium 41_269]|nr:MAG: hypothetical protein XD50_1358 [Clostridia bacterium 41_269]